MADPNIRLALLPAGDGYVLAWEQRDSEGWYDSARVCWPAGRPPAPYAFERLHPRGQRIANLVRALATLAGVRSRPGEAVAFLWRADAHDALRAAQAAMEVDRG